jgi:hypothetical protein
MNFENTSMGCLNLVITNFYKLKYLNCLIYKL